jgi:hypothetical protein
VVFSFSPSSSYFVFLILDGGWFVFYSRMLLILVYFFWGGEFAFSLGASGLKVLVGWVLIAVHLHVGNMTFFGASGLINFNKSL